MFRKRGLLAFQGRRLTEVEREQAAALSPFRPLLATYQAKEAFLAIYEAKDRRQADQALTRWLETLAVEIPIYFQELTPGASNNREIILSYFDRRCTNAFTEAANGISKLLQRKGADTDLKS